MKTLVGDDDDDDDDGDRLVEGLPAPETQIRPATNRTCLWERDRCACVRYIYVCMETVNPRWLARRAKDDAFNYYR